MILCFFGVVEQRENEGYVEKRLQQRKQEKLNGLEDFKVSVDFAKTLNSTLKDKMMEANEERAQALFTKQKVNKIVSAIEETKEEIVAPKGKIKMRAVSKAMASLGIKEEEPSEMERSILKEETEQMDMAIKVLMGEYVQRKAIRNRAKDTTGKISKRIGAMTAFEKKRETFSKIKQTQLDEIAAYAKKKEEYHRKQQELEKQKEKELENEKGKQKELEDKQAKGSTSGLGRDKLESTNSDGGFGVFDEDGGDVFSTERGRNRLPSNSNDTEAGLTRKDSKKAKKEKEKQKKDRAPTVVNNVFYWDRQQNQKGNSTFANR